MNWVYFISSIIACEYVCLFVYRDVHASVGGGQWYQMVPKLAGVAGACEPLAWVMGTELWPSTRIGSVLTVKLSAHLPPHPPFSFFDTGFYVVQAGLKVALSSKTKAGLRQLILPLLPLKAWDSICESPCPAQHLIFHQLPVPSVQHRNHRLHLVLLPR